jgi:hypothetical protein
MQVKAYISKYSQQMVACMRSERGIELAYPLFVESAKSSVPTCKEIREINEIKDGLAHTLMQLN